MARVVTQRKKTPYLLIIFVFLFVIASVLAFMGFNEQDKLRVKIARLETEVTNSSASNPGFKEICASQQRDLLDLSAIMFGGSTEAGYAGAKANQKAISEFKSSINKAFRKAEPVDKLLSNLLNNTQKYVDNSLEKALNASPKAKAFVGTGITPFNGDSSSAPKITQIGLLKTIYALTDITTSTFPEIQRLATKIENQNADYAKLEKALLVKQNEIDALKVQKSKLEQKNIANLADAKRDYEEKLKAQADEAATALAAVTKEKEEIEGKYQAQIDKTTKESKKIAKKDQNITELRTKLRDKEAEIINEPDGKIIKIVPGKNLCYVNIGKKAKVKTGVTYVVYGAKDSKGKDNVNDYKAIIRITKVLGPDTSAATITYVSNDENPVRANDQIANIAVKSSRHYHFVVVGNFDLTGEGSASERGRKQVVKYLQKCGGKIQDNIDHKTDFLVLGEPIMKPTPPSEDSEDVSDEAYNQALKRYKKRQKLINKARELGIKILNTNRLLEFTGMVSPEKKKD